MKNNRCSDTMKAPEIKCNSKNLDHIVNIQVEDIEISQVFDEEGYHCDTEVKDFKYNGNGCYSLTIKNNGRSDKTISKTNDK